MSLEFTKISGSTPYFLNSASTAEELTVALEDYMRTGTQIIFQHDGEDCILSSFEYKAGIDSTVIAYFVTPKKKLLKVDTAAGYDLVITESEITPELDKTLTQENKAADAKATGEAITSLKSTINDLHTDVEIWFVMDGVPMNYGDLAKEDGATLNIHLVDTLPDTLIPTDMENYIMNAYVVEGTGIAYININGAVYTLGQMMFNQDGFDKGFTDDINAETEDGFYSVRAYKDFAEKKDITWENLPDKPFGETVEYGDTLTVDKSVLEGNIVTDTSGNFVKVSDAVPTIDDFVNGFVATADEVTFEATYEEVLGAYNELGVFGWDFFFAIPSDNFTPQGDGAPTFPEKGFYIGIFIFGDVQTFSIKIPDYKGFTTTTVKKIEEKYLPIFETVSGGEVSLGDTVSWDGNIETFEGVKTDKYTEEPVSIQFVKVSDSIPTVDDIGSNSTFKWMDSGSETTNTATAILTNDDGSISVGDDAIYAINIIPTANFTDGSGIVYPEAGVYFGYMDVNGSLGYATEFTIPNYNFTIKQPDKKVIKASLLPESKGGGIIDVTELPTENIDEQSIYRVTKSMAPTIYWHDGVSISDFVEWMASTQGITMSVVSVATIEGVTLEEGIIYVDESTGFAWANMQGTTNTIGQMLYQVTDNSYDKGWTEDTSTETEKGIYCVRGENSVTYHACKDGVWTELVSKEYVDNTVANALIITSSTEGSTKKFKITVDDSGTITATEVT